MHKKYVLFVIALLLSIALDQGSKIWARHTLRPIYPEAATVVPGYFELRYSENPGSAFSLFGRVAGARWGLLIVGIGALGLVGYYLRKAPNGSAVIGGSLGLLAGGAIGNMIDRAMVGRVTDFIVWKVGAHEWPTFNIADAALVIGVAALLLSSGGASQSETPQKVERKRAA
jgi:lipoprotein signal peptidase